jgi:hypothetical protein
VVVGAPVIGAWLGVAVGDLVGDVVGTAVGAATGAIVGLAEGAAVGDVVGTRVGASVGRLVSVNVGAGDTGAAEMVGDSVGENVGTCAQRMYANPPAGEFGLSGAWAKHSDGVTPTAHSPTPTNPALHWDIELDPVVADTPDGLDSSGVDEATPQSCTTTAGDPAC